MKKPTYKMHPLKRTIKRLEKELSERKMSPAEEAELNEESYARYKQLIEDLEEEIQRLENFLI